MDGSLGNHDSSANNVDVEVVKKTTASSHTNATNAIVQLLIKDI